jgi:hypothetical protein
MSTPAALSISRQLFRNCCSLPRLIAWVMFVMSSIALQPAHAADSADCTTAANDGCLMTFSPPGTTLVSRYYASLPQNSSATTGPGNVLIVMHGHPHDANKTFNAGLAATRSAQQLQATLVVAPLLQVDSAHASRCSTPGVPAAQPNELTWTCQTWMDGETASNDPHVTSFAALDGLIADVVARWPSVKTITFAGFSAGAQVVQHYIGFSALPPGNVTLRFVVADPGTWLYFDPVRPVLDTAAVCQGAGDTSRCAIGFARPDSGTCTDYDDWKYGIAHIPAALAASAANAKTRYTQAEIRYLEGELDSSDGPGRASRVLDKSCGANLEGSYRLQRGQAYASYDAQILRPAQPHTLQVVPGCAHDVACVFPSEIGRATLFPVAASKP